MMSYGQQGELEALLAAGFGGLTLNLLREQLPHLGLRLDRAAAEMRAFAGDNAVDGLIRETAGDAFNSALLAMMRERQSDGSDRLGEDHRMLKRSFRTFAEREVKPMAEKFHREDLLIPDELIRRVAELGCFGLSIPQEYGGFQERPDNLGMVVVTEELSRGALIFGSLITRPEILSKALLVGGTEAQKRRWLPKLASGENMVGVAVTEPDFGSDVASMGVTAGPVEGGWLINGTKTWSTFSGRAELLALLARTESDPALGHRGLSLFVVEKPAYDGHAFEHVNPRGGVLRGRAIATLGYRGMHSFELNFDDYFVPAENLIGEAQGRGKGFYLQMEGFSGGRMQTAGRALGVMQAAFELARDYAASRKVFGKALGDYPLTREKLARMAVTVQGCRQMAYAAARLLDDGRGKLEASMVKFLACRQAEWITREAQQLHGGMGYAEEFPVSRLFLDARVLSIFEGTEEILALRVIMPAVLKDVLDAA
ncbi:MAG: acyl-CoA/acyl-ACP dehydrogenase [Candidatus Lambdaproteobacteria bacterium]|nr:acyl-CoA/acyl-ACP dehydrogenase [Candidatus Lambdaproteobacteria bacterium]